MKATKYRLIQLKSLLRKYNLPISEKVLNEFIEEIKKIIIKDTRKEQEVTRYCSAWKKLVGKC